MFQTWISHLNWLTVFDPAWHGYTEMVLCAWERWCEGGYLAITGSERKVFEILFNKLGFIDFLGAGIDGGEGSEFRKPDVLNLCLRRFLGKLLTKLLTLAIGMA